ncbi:MAG: hypothetical protein KI792_02540 [Alphaproteobacteria bacterium]|nr:hypothetical protein [Alphaproteobacteria bacterium SS10]
MPDGSITADLLRPSAVLPSGPLPNLAGTAETPQSGPFGILKQALEGLGNALPSKRAVALSIALTSVVVPTAAMACDLRAGIPPVPSNEFLPTTPGVECIWFDSPVLAETAPINENTVTRICARDGVDRFSRGVSPLGEGPPSPTPGTPARDHFIELHRDLANLSFRLTRAAQAVNPEFEMPEGHFRSKPLMQQLRSVLFPGGRAEALERETNAVRSVLEAAGQELDPGLCTDLQAAMERAVNGDQLADRRRSILQYDQGFASNLNQLYREWQREEDRRQQRSMPPPGQRL